MAKNEKLTIRLSKEELEALKECAAEKGILLSELVRSRALRGIKLKKEDEFQRFERELQENGKEITTKELIMRDFNLSEYKYRKYYKIILKIYKPISSLRYKKK